MRLLACLSLLGVAGCDQAVKSEAQAIVQRQLGNPASIDFRRLRVKSSEHSSIVCGEVEASDRPGAGWRYFVAYPTVGGAAIAPPGGIGPEGEMGNPLLAGAADGFNHACD